MKSSCLVACLTLLLATACLDFEKQTMTACYYPKVDTMVILQNYEGIFGDDLENGLSEEELETKYSDAEPFHCSLPWEMPVIDTQGNVIPCGAPVREHTRDFILGNITEGDTIKGCWNGEQMNQLRDLHSKGEWYKNPMCRVCVNTLRSSRRRLAKLRQLAGKGPAGELPKAG